MPPLFLFPVIQTEVLQSAQQTVSVLYFTMTNSRYCQFQYWKDEIDRLGIDVHQTKVKYWIPLANEMIRRDCNVETLLYSSAISWWLSFSPHGERWAGGRGSLLPPDPLRTEECVPGHKQNKLLLVLLQPKPSHQLTTGHQNNRERSCWTG